MENQKGQSDTASKPLSNGEKIQAINQLYTELDILKEESSDAIKLAKQFKDNEVEITRKDGKVNKLKEQLLWDEIRVLSDQTEAYEFMKAKYPKAFELSEAVSKKAHEIDEFSMLHFGLHADRITLRDIINLIQLFIEK